MLTLLEGGTYLIFPLVKLILGLPLPDNYCTVPEMQLRASSHTKAIKRNSARSATTAWFNTVKGTIHLWKKQSFTLLLGQI